MTRASTLRTFCVPAIATLDPEPAKATLKAGERYYWRGPVRAVCAGVSGGGAEAELSAAPARAARSCRCRIGWSFRRASRWRPCWPGRSRCGRVVHPAPRGLAGIVHHVEFPAVLRMKASPGRAVRQASTHR